MVRSIGALLGGAAAMAAVVIVGTVAGAALLAGPGGSVTGAYLVANLAVSFGAAALGGWLVAWLAPRRPLAHAAALGGVVVLLALPGLASPAPGQPSWYPLVILLVGIAGVGCGALLRQTAVAVSAAVGPPAPGSPA